MRAVTIQDGALQVAERPDPVPGPGEVVVRVHGAGLNRADLLQRAGRYPAPPGVPADVPGLEFAGVVESAAPDVHNLEPGARVFGVAAGGAQAERLAVPAVQCALAPDTDLVTLGGVPEAFITAHDAMVTQAGLTAGEWVLVDAVGSGVGTAALQLAKALGASVIGTARTAEKLDRAARLGLDAGVVPTLEADGTLDTDALALAVVEHSGGGAHVTLDLVGGDYLVAAVHGAALRGRIVCIGTIAGGRATVPLGLVLAKRLTIIGTVLRARTVAEKAAATDAFVRDVVPRLASGALAPVIEATFPLADVAAAYDLVASDATFGKVVLDCR